jgi:hypothetical protein
VITEVHMRIIVELPKPMVAIIVDANAHRPYELAGIAMPGLENPVLGNSVIGV